jgi:hypothetical protein
MINNLIRIGVLAPPEMMNILILNGEDGIVVELASLREKPPGFRLGK